MLIQLISATEDVKPVAQRASVDDKDALPSLPLAAAASSNRRSANGYVSEGESLAMPYLHMGGARSGYLSEDGGLIGDGGAKVREQFAAATRYCLRRHRDR
ncbi:hypothetical protein AAVH_37456 [Aphelenchoides avenae]|nr:hypothetical protein AAVH_37456 [Aphelenchus avenae]